MARSPSLLQQMDFCVKYFSLVAIETCQHISAEVICWRTVCCVAQRWQEWIIPSPQSRLIKTWSLGVSLQTAACRGHPAKVIMPGTFAACLEVNEAGGRSKLQKLLKAEKNSRLKHNWMWKKNRRKFMMTFKMMIYRRMGSRSQFWWKEPPKDILSGRTGHEPSEGVWRNEPSAAMPGAAHSQEQQPWPRSQTQLRASQQGCSPVNQGWNALLLIPREPNLSSSKLKMLEAENPR